jgi:predicted nuclease of predicted toxin-antitoxin system
VKARPLRFLADESLDFAVVRSLRAAGHEVLAVCESLSGAADSDLIALAAREQRILVTEDKDFGWLVFVTHAQSAGVILIRFPGNTRESLVQTMDELVRDQAENLADSFTVVEPGQVRISKRPDPSHD